MTGKVADPVGAGFRNFSMNPDTEPGPGFSNSVLHDLDPVKNGPDPQPYISRN